MNRDRLYFLLLNIVKRLPLIGEPGERLSLTALAKVGVGVVIPHTQNTVLGRDNRPGFQFGGTAAGVEAAAAAG